MEGLKQYFFAGVGLGLILAFAKFALRSECIHGAESMLVVNVFVGHTKMGLKPPYLTRDVWGSQAADRF